MDRQILFVFKVGHSVQRRAKPLSNRTHHWRCYVDSWNPNYPLSALVRKVTFWLHDTFENPRQVVRQPPFAIEEDGFGHFQLQIEVAFLDCVTTFTYDLRLFDNNALHTYRTVRVIPAPEDWDRMIQLGGIVIPRTNTPADIHKVVQTIQSCNNLESMHSYSFFPHLRDRSEQDVHSLSPASVGSTACKPSDSVPFYPETVGRQSAGQDYCFDYQDETCSGSLTHSDPDIPRQSVLSVERLLAQRPLPQKHKKKLQLLHEAQLLLEDAQKRQSQWASSRPVTAPGSGSPQYNLMPLSPDIPTPSKGAPPLDSAGDQEEMEPLLSTNNLSVGKDQNDIGSLPDRKSGFGTAEPSSPVKRIVLKLSRLGSKNQLVVASSDLEGQDTMDERQERRRRKKEQRREQARLEEEKARQFGISDSKTENPSLKPNELLTREVAAAPVTGYADVKSPRKLKKHRRLKAGKRAAIDALDQPSPLISPKANLVSDQLPDLVKLESESRKGQLSPEGITASQCMGQVQPESEFHGHIGPFVEHELFGSDDESHLLGDQTNQYSPKVSSPFEHGAHSHLLLDNPDEEFEDALSRSLFSQCHESTNPGSPVDLFGDEDRLSSAHTTPHVVDLRYPASSPNESTGSRPYDPEDLLTSKPRQIGGELFEDTGDECIPLSRHSSTDRSEKSIDFVRSRPSRPVSKSRPSKVSTDSSASGADHGRPVSGSHKKHKNSDKQKSQMKHGQQDSVSRERTCVSSPGRPSSASKTAPEKVDSGVPRSRSVNKSTDFRKQHARSSSSHSSSSSCREKERKKIDRNPSKHMHPNTSKHGEQIHTPKIQSSSPKIKPPKSDAVGKPRKQVSADETETSDRKLSDSKRSHVSKDFSTTKSKKMEAKKQNYSDKPLAGESVGPRKEHLRSQSGLRRTATVPQDSKHSSKGPSQERRKMYLKRFKEHDIELSSLSSSSSSSVSSSPTPPMSSCNPVFSGTASEPSCFDKAHKSQSRQPVPSQVTKHSGDKRSKKKINPPPTCGPAQLETTGISNEKLNAAVKPTTSESAKPLDMNVEPQLSDGTNNQSKYSGSQLEHLFDRLLRLQQPHLAIRMSEILLQYLVPRPPTSTSKSQNNEAAAAVGSKVKSGRAVKVLNEGEPRIIAFNLRRLPFVCLDQLSELIAEDEAISFNSSANGEKHNSTASELMSPSKDLVL